MSRMALSNRAPRDCFVRHNSLQMHWPPKSARLYTVDFWIALGGQNFIKVGNKFRRIIIIDYRILQIALQHLTVATQRPTVCNSSDENIAVAPTAMSMLFRVKMTESLSFLLNFQPPVLACPRLIMLCSAIQQNCSEIKGKIHEQCVNLSFPIHSCYAEPLGTFTLLINKRSFARGNLEILRNSNPFITLYHFGSLTRPFSQCIEFFHSHSAQSHFCCLA